MSCVSARRCTATGQHARAAHRTTYCVMCVSMRSHLHESPALVCCAFQRDDVIRVTMSHHNHKTVLAAQSTPHHCVCVGNDSSHVEWCHPCLWTRVLCNAPQCGPTLLRGVTSTTACCSFTSDGRHAIQSGCCCCCCCFESCDAHRLRAWHPLHAVQNVIAWEWVETICITPNMKKW